MTQLEILPEPPATRAESTPWPQWPLMRRDSSSHKEGDTHRYWGVDTTAFIGEKGRVRSIHCVQVEWAFDETRGQTCPRRIPGAEFELETDLALLAMGFIAPGPTALVDQLGIEKNQRGFVAADTRHMTNVEGVFVAGDMQSGPSLVVRAMADGMRTAESVIAHLDEARATLAPHPGRHAELATPG